MKKRFLTLTLCLLALIILVNYNWTVKFNSIEKKTYYSSTEQLNLISGTYTSNDGKTIKIDENSSVIYENTYSLQMHHSLLLNHLIGKKLQTSYHYLFSLQWYFLYLILLNLTNMYFHILHLNFHQF